MTAPGLVHHRICDNKGAGTFGALVGNYKGTIVCDDAVTHNAGARASPGITLAGSWAHILRKFAEAVPDFPDAQLMINWIRDLYRLDAQATTVEERGKRRRQEAPAILDKMRMWMNAKRVPATTNLGRAIRHALKAHNWAKLTAFVSNPLVWLDNNATERGLRGPVIGRGNHFGSKSVHGTEIAATMYTLVESAKASGADPMAYSSKSRSSIRRRSFCPLISSPASRIAPRRDITPPRRVQDWGRRGDTLQPATIALSSP